MADDTEYRIIGRVVNQRTKQGERGLRVEAWDRDTRFHDLLGDAVTDRDGNFTIKFTGAYFGDFAPDSTPDLFFKIFLGDALLKSTQAEPMENVRETEIKVTLSVDVPEERPATPDRISATKTIQAVEFVRQSDFRGIGREAKSRASTFGGAVGGILVSALRNFNFEPLKPPAVRTNDVVGQDALAAEKNLGTKGLVVNDRVAFKAGDIAQNALIVRSLPSNLKSGDKVNLYVDENQQVRGYVVVKPTAATSVSQDDVVRIETEVGDLRANLREVASVREELTTLQSSTEQEQSGLRDQITDLQAQLRKMDTLRAELDSVRKDSLAKDTVISSLTEQVNSLKTQQDQILEHASPQRLADIEAVLKRLQVPAAGGVINPVVVAPRELRAARGKVAEQSSVEGDESATPVAKPKGRPKRPPRPPSGGARKKKP